VNKSSQLQDCVTNNVLSCVWKHKCL